MTLVELMWAYVKASAARRRPPAPRGATNLWVDLNAAHQKIHAQEIELGDLKEAVSYLAGIVEDMRGRFSDRLCELEKEIPHERSDS